MTVVKMLALEYPGWIIRWWLTYEQQRQIDVATGAWVVTERGVFGIDPSVCGSRLEAERWARAITRQS